MRPGSREMERCRWEGHNFQPLKDVQCLQTVVAFQHSDSDYSSDMYTVEHLQHTDTFTVTTGADIDWRLTGDPPHSIQFPVLTAVPQFGCTGTDTLLQRARFTVWYSPQERLHTSPVINALNKETLKKQSETGEAEVKLRSSFNKRTEFSQNCNSERGQLAELLPNSGKRTTFRRQCKWWMHQTARRYKSLS